MLLRYRNRQSRWSVESDSALIWLQIVGRRRVSFRDRVTARLNGVPSRDLSRIEESNRMRWYGNPTAARTHLHHFAAFRASLLLCLVRLTQDSVPFGIENINVFGES